MTYIRIIIFLILILPYSILVNIIGHVLKPFTGFGTSAIQLLCKLWSKLIVWGLSLNIELEGGEHLNYDGPQLLLSNHQSNLDPVVLWDIKPNNINLCFAAKKALFNLPVFGRILHHNRSVVIDRKSPKQSLKRLIQSFDKPAFIRSLLIFPEGTRSKTNEILPLKKGPFILAKKSDLRIVPIKISGTIDAFPKGHIIPKFGTKVTVKCAQPITEQEVSALGVDELTAKVETIIKRL